MVQAQVVVVGDYSLIMQVVWIGAASNVISGERLAYIFFETKRQLNHIVLGNKKKLNA